MWYITRPLSRQRRLYSASDEASLARRKAVNGTSGGAPRRPSSISCLPESMPQTYWQREGSVKGSGDPVKDP